MGRSVDIKVVRDESGHGDGLICHFYAHVANLWRLYSSCDPFKLNCLMFSMRLGYQSSLVLFFGSRMWSEILQRLWTCVFAAVFTH